MDKLSEIVIGVLSGYQDNRQWRVADHLRKFTGEKKDYLKEIKCPRFGNREGKVQITDFLNLEGSDFYILDDVGNFRKDKMGDRNRPDEHVSDIRNTLGAITNGQENASNKLDREFKLNRINIFTPLGPYSRQHRDSENIEIAESLGAVDTVRDWANWGVDNVLFTDHHAIGDLRKHRHLQNGPLNIHNLTPTYSISKQLIINEGAHNVVPEKMVIVAPDEGAEHRAKQYAEILGLDYVVIPKGRDTSIIDENGGNPIEKKVLDEQQKREITEMVYGKNALIVDDMIASGGTNINRAELLRDLGADRIICAATFGIFNNGGVDKFHKAYHDGLIDSVYSTDAAYLPSELTGYKWFIKVGGTELIAAGIYNNNRSQNTQEFNRNMGEYYAQKQHEINEIIRG